MATCSHLDQVKVVTPKSAGCAECLLLGESWVHLRMCMSCGHVGCCDDSKNKHATQHFHETDHAIVRSLEPSEDWKWCYADEMYVEPESEAAGQPENGRDGGKSASVIRTYLIIAGLYTLSASLIWGVNTLFLLDAGLDIFGVFIVNAVFTGSMAPFGWQSPFT